MPINNDLPDIKSPVPNRHYEKSVTDFYEHLGSINVQLLNYPTMTELLEYIPRWGTATWNDSPHNNYLLYEREEIVKDLFEGNILPSAMETIGLTFLISNMDLIDVTHLLRHRTMSFSAVCSADRDMRHDKCLVKNSIIQSDYFARFISIVNKAKQLYEEMVDTDEISLLDARTILPRCLEHHYYARVNLRDFLHFVKQRIDRQIQPESDNIIALKMWIEVVKVYPLAKSLIDVHTPDAWYVKTAPTSRSSNIYMPEFPRNDVFEYKEQWFLYKKQRSEMNGGQHFINLWNDLVKELEEI